MKGRNALEFPRISNFRLCELSMAYTVSDCCADCFIVWIAYMLLFHCQTGVYQLEQERMSLTDKLLKEKVRENRS